MMPVGLMEILIILGVLAGTFALAFLIRLWRSWRH
jgi:hypothetical protein